MRISKVRGFYLGLWSVVCGLWSIIAWGWGPGIEMAAIDELWPHIQQAVAAKYPSLCGDYNAKDWNRIKSFAHGGSIASEKDYYEILDRDYLFSDLSLCLLSGDLTNAMRNLANTPEETAFASGWVVNFLANQYGHHSFVNPLAGRTAGGSYLAPSGNEPTMGKVKLFLDGYWIPDWDRPLSFPPSLINQALQEVYGISWSNSSNFFNPAPHSPLINLGLGEFRAAWPKTERRTHTTRAGLTYKIMTQSSKLSLFIKLTYPPANFEAVEKAFNPNREANEKQMLAIFYKIVDSAAGYIKNPSQRLPNLTIHLAVPPLNDNGYGYSIRGLKGWMRYGNFDHLTPERAQLLKSYRDKYLD